MHLELPIIEVEGFESMARLESMEIKEIKDRPTI